MQLVMTCVNLYALSLTCAALRSLTYGKTATVEKITLYNMNSKSRNELVHFFARDVTQDMTVYQNPTYRRLLNEIRQKTPQCDLRQLRINVRLNRSLIRRTLQRQQQQHTHLKPIVGERDCTEKIWDTMLTVYDRRKSKKLRLAEADGVRDKQYMERYAYCAMPNQVKNPAQMSDLLDTIMRRSDRDADIRNKDMRDAHLIHDLVGWSTRIRCVDPRGRKVKQFEFPALIGMDLKTLPFSRRHRGMAENRRKYGSGGISYGTARIHDVTDSRLALRLLHEKPRTPRHVDFCRSIQPNGIMD